MSSVFEDFDTPKVIDYLNSNVDAVLVVDGDADRYRSLFRKGIFTEFLEDEGDYHELIKNLWFHFDKSSEKVVEDYEVFIPAAGEFSGKYSKRVVIVMNDKHHLIQMTVYPIVPNHTYIFILDELDSSLYLDTDLTNQKVTTIQNTYLFSMYMDLVNDSINSISVTEISDEVMHQQIKYSDWRMKIVKMISKEDQPLFLERSDPEYLKKNLAPGRTSSFDCLMMNLEGKYIWVKIIFSRAETDNPDDYRYVYMVQNIHETAMELRSTLKKYEQMALHDPLTSVFNHGRIETEMRNAIVSKNKNDKNSSFMILDIDHFKKVNDTYGHHTGDVTLIHFVETVKKIIGDSNAVVGRWGGEEFVVVMNGMNIEQAKELAEKVRSGIENESFKKVGEITCSIGVTEVVKGDELKKAFQRMDEAVYVAKKRGRNNVVVGR